MRYFTCRWRAVSRRGGRFCSSWEAYGLRTRGSGGVAEKSRRDVFGGAEEIDRNCSPFWSFERGGLNVGGIIKCATSVEIYKTAPI
jgi:hypothetical protein